MASNSIYWNASAAPARTTSESALPERVDVAIVGAGYTGLASAIHLARAGRSVAVFDAEENLMAAVVADHEALRALCIHYSRFI